MDERQDGGSAVEGFASRDLGAQLEPASPARRSYEITDVAEATMADHLTPLEADVDVLRAAYADSRLAGLMEAAEIAKVATEKWGRPIGTQYEEGTQDHGHRIHAAIHAAIRALTVSSPAQATSTKCKWCGGNGVVTDSGAFGYGGSTATCSACEGTGRADSFMSTKRVPG